MDKMKRQKDLTPEDEPPGQKVSNMLLGKSRDNLQVVPERMKQLDQSRNDAQLWMCPVVKVKYNAGKNNTVQAWNVRSMNQGKMDMVKQEMARLNIDVLGISDLKWTGKDKFISDDHYIYYCGQESLRRSGVALIVNKSPKCSIWLNDRMISVHFQGKPCNITVIQVYAPTTDAKDTEVDRFYDDLQHFLELTPQKCPFHHRGLECKCRKSRDTQNNRQVWPWSTK